MKFGSELEDGLVPEWRSQYFDYKGAKKQLKNVTSAIRRAEPSIDNNGSIRTPLTSLRDGPVQTYLQLTRKCKDSPNAAANPETSNQLKITRSRSEAQIEPVKIPVNERSPLKGPVRFKEDDSAPPLKRYGSIIGTPPTRESLEVLNRAPTLELPVPAIEVPRGDETNDQADDEYDRPVSPGTAELPPPDSPPVPPSSQLAHRGNAYKIAKPVDISPSKVDRPFVRRFTSFATSQTSRHAKADRQNDIALEAYRELDLRQDQFFAFLDKELKKIESFYKTQETTAENRLTSLKEQLHILRDRRMEEMQATEQHRALSRQSNNNNEPQNLRALETIPSAYSRRSHPFRASVDAAKEVISKTKPGHVGKTSQAMGTLASPKDINSGRDYERHPVQYRTAKRLLKTAFAELYRGLELIKSYAMMNRTAFRKITKKFDKAVTSTRGKHYNKDDIGKAYFVTSDKVGVIMQSVEDLYARYFERGNHKVAVGKLRHKVFKEGAFYASTVRAWLVIGISSVFAIEGLTYGSEELLQSPDPVIRVQTSYLLQLYAGYFLMLLLFSLFCADAALFTSYRVNYQFIFEFDPRHMLNWKQLCEPPAWCFLALGLIMWCNFSSWAPPVMFIYWPTILIGVTIILLFLPLPIFYWRSRSWFVQSNLRLLLPGFSRVEFRDFFLGDMFCSLTYALGNIELFFCLYARKWNDPPQCNSSHSMLLGFFSTVPGIIRLVQCFRRYYNSGLWTHLLNAMKYTFTILQYMSLSLWRIYKSPGYLAFFIVSAICNSVFCSFWDLSYDWSMPFLNAYAKPYPFLRETLAYKKHIWWYYVAMIIDPILRFNWIFYVIYRHDLQHSSLVSFLIALSEVFRRGMWVIFRVENEHCSNVTASKAMRDPTLPFEIRRSGSDSTTEHADRVPSARTSARDEEAGTPSTPSLRRRMTAAEESPMFTALKRVGSTFRAAHAQDYERKKRPEDEQGEHKDDDETDSE